ncbi:tetratricopeptide repeat protein [Massilibacteroides vaginae]|uniref:tetratricopeptide repeat protein n=1 Tax=Massilibacteroides vaginae TaxID=1673718 RepID=UPI00111C124B|nr:hypothetical protein [Massilibacteroides vaginae]
MKHLILRTSLLTLFLLTIPHFLFAKEVAKVNKNTADSLLDVSFDQYVKVDIEGNIKTASEALNISKSLNYSAGISKSYFYLARALTYLGEYEKSLHYLQLCEKEPYTKKSFDIHSELCRIRGQVFTYLGLPSAAINEFKKGLLYVNRIEDVSRKARLTSLAYENLTVCYKNIEEYDSMYYCIKQNNDLLNNYNFPYHNHNKINLYTMYGDYFTITEKYDSASYFFNKAILITKANKMNYTSWIHKHWGDMEMKRNNPDSALTYYYLALDNLNKTQMKNEFQELYQQMAKAYEKNGEMDSANFYSNNAIRTENDVLNARREATENALNLLVSEEGKRLNDTFTGKIKKLAYLLTGLLVIVAIIWLKWRSNQKQKLEKYEKKVEVLRGRLNNNMKELIDLAKANDNTFITLFMKTYPTFTKSIYQSHPDLISSEFWFCAMLFMDFSSKEIAQYSFVEHRSIQIRKSRLRKKLKLNSNIDLYQYIKSFQESSQANL